MRLPWGSTSTRSVLKSEFGECGGKIGGQRGLPTPPFCETMAMLIPMDLVLSLLGDPRTRSGGPDGVCSGLADGLNARLQQSGGARRRTHHTEAPVPQRNGTHLHRWKLTLRRQAVGLRAACAGEMAGTPSRGTRTRHLPRIDPVCCSKRQPGSGIQSQGGQARWKSPRSRFASGEISVYELW